MTKAPKVPPCPRCGSGDVVEVVYGYPLPSTAARARAGQIFLGGCLVDFDNENEERARCRVCDHEWSVPMGTFPEPDDKWTTLDPFQDEPNTRSRP